MVSIESFLALQRREMTGNKLIENEVEVEKEAGAEVEKVIEEGDEVEKEVEMKDLVLSDPKISRRSDVHPVDPVLDRALFDRYSRSNPIPLRYNADRRM